MERLLEKIWWRRWFLRLDLGDWDAGRERMDKDRDGEVWDVFGRWKGFRLVQLIFMVVGFCGSLFMLGVKVKIVEKIGLRVWGCGFRKKLQFQVMN